MNKIKHFLFAALLVLPFLMFSSAKANDGHDGRDGRDGHEGHEPKFGDKDMDHGSKKGSSVPIDGGLSLLLAAGIGLGAKKVAAHRKLKKQAATI
jgi:hypothetical protein